MEQLVARRAHNPEAVGSNPAPATKKSYPRQNASGLLISTYPSDCKASGDLPSVQVSAVRCTHMVVLLRMLGWLQKCSCLFYEKNSLR